MKILENEKIKKSETLATFLNKTIIHNQNLQKSYLFVSVSVETLISYVLNKISKLFDFQIFDEFQFL